MNRKLEELLAKGEALKEGLEKELDAILNSNSASLNGCTLYVTLFPCNECAKAIIQSGIKRVVYYSNKYKGTDGVTASQFLFDKCGVKTEQYQKSGKEIVLSL